MRSTKYSWIEEKKEIRNRECVFINAVLHLNIFSTVWVKMSWQRSMHHLKISTIFHCNNLTSFSNHWKNLRFSWPALNLCDGISWYRFYLCMKSTHKSAFTHLTFYTILRETADVDTYKIKQWTYSHSGYEI